MAKSKPKILPRFRALDKIVEFFDSHDLGEYWGEMPEVQFEVDINRRLHLLAIDPDIADKLMEIARSRRISTEGLVNCWLKEKMLEQAQADSS